MVGLWTKKRELTGWLEAHQFQVSEKGYVKK
jgi:hypothetical protein